VQGHEVERNLHLLTALGVHGVSPASRLRLRITAVARQKAAAYFVRSGITSEDVVVGLIPGSQWGTKRWPAERFAALIDHLAGTQALRCVLIGGPQDRSIAQAIRARCTVPVLDLIGQTTLQELPACLERCTVVVSNDTGPMHIAAAVGRPIVALFGPTTPEMGFAPYGVPWEEVSVALACRPCHAHGPQHCPLSHWRCMLELPVERVAASVQRLLCRQSVPGEERA
jgi:heptosyltransferase-2